MKNRKILILLLTLLLTLSVSASAIDFTGQFEDDSAEPAGDVEETTVDDYKDIELSGIKDDGQLRVYLRSLNLPLSMTIRVQGEYTLGHDAGYRFDSGTQLTFSDGGDRIYMTVGGFTMDMGQKVELTRQASGSEQSGLCILETQRTNIYPGDLTITREEAGGGLKPVLTVNIEDYLLGVIAYEMSDSWPVEALKSQAVAARTYAMQRKKTNSGNDYDLVDTTADQVYRGTDASLMNVASAVRATTGVVGMYKGEYATCYYTASNGGEVALPSDVWEDTGNTDYGYLERKEDPYDVENPNSVVKTLSISSDCEESPELKALIEEKIGDAAEAAGEDPEGLCLETIISMEPADPEPADSKMYRTLRVTAAVQRCTTEYVASDNDIGAPASKTGVAAADMALAGVDMLRRVLNDSPFEPEEAYESLDKTYTVDLSVYEDIKPLGLEINTLDCELISVTTGQFGFTISMTRFGHGVGMSQRGAQRMAGVNEMKWQDILAFYYPGMELTRLEWDTPELEQLEQLPSNVGAVFTAPTATPEPAELPELQEGEHYAVVNLNSVSSTLNMRAMPTTESRIVAVLGEGRRLIVSSEPDENGWVSVHTAEYSGYVKAEYLKDEE